MLTKDQRKALCAELGLQFNIKDDEELTYEKIFRAIELGEPFDEICRSLDLEPSLVEDHVKKYVLHLIFEEAATFNEYDMELIRNYCEEPLINTTIGELFEQVQNELFLVESDSFQQYLLSVIDAQKNIKKTYLTKENENYYDPVYPFHKRNHTLFPFYFNHFVNKKRPIKPQSLDKDSSKDFFSDLLVHINQIKGLLTGNGYNINPTREIIEFERETNIFFLLKVQSMLPKEKLIKMSSNRKDNYYKALASMSLIEDIRLKLYFVERFIAEDNEFLFTKTQDGYNRLFWLIFFYLPLLKDFIKDRIKAPQGTLSVKDPFVDDKEQATQLRRVKKKLFLCFILKNNPCYSVLELKREYIFQLDELEYSNNFDDLYMNVNKFKKHREQFCKETIEITAKEINKNGGFPENLDYLFCLLAKSLVTEMALHSDDKIPEFEEPFEKYFNEQKISEKIEQLNVEKLSDYK
ncbi:hypothetical protein [Neobacillus kokaensis]|uniref:Uncharacterized protein n=1 Tax=Neobacillus kokaensis TaxID=2759023 RepID=A0ABQ3N297_9BACI|nr:hypothetical protein [Neobacillus kokaensis]GHH96655.1 hypothetical protein AM1BK_01980 [Neobacillus kokaensis]